jgi:hypothetical protein
MATGDRTKTFTVDAAGNPEPITVQSYCMKVVIYEDAQAGTTDYILHVPAMASSGVTKPAGSKAEISRGERYVPGDIVGYVETVSGSVTFAQEEWFL